MQALGVRIRRAIPEEWERVRELRLRSLEDAPEAFGSRRGRSGARTCMRCGSIPAWGTRGLGAELVREVLDWARSWGALWMVLAITESNDGAARFYERIGFVDTALRHPLRDGSPLSVRVLRREP
jgi:GNAT superfamily N-acetyltransferase